MDATTINRHIQQQNFVKITRNLPGNSEELRGFILAKSASLLLIQSTYDFMFDGYAVVRLADIVKIRNGKFEKMSKRIFKQEGLFKSSFGLNTEISLKTWQNVFADLKQLDYHAIVQCEDKKEADFVIGPIKRVSASTVSIQYYDPAGKLESKLSKLRFEETTIVRFGDNYSTIIRKYLTPRAK